MMDIMFFMDRDFGIWDFFVVLKDVFEKIGVKCFSKFEDFLFVKRICVSIGEFCFCDGYWLIVDMMDK